MPGLFRVEDYGTTAAAVNAAMADAAAFVAGAGARRRATLDLARLDLTLDARIALKSRVDIVGDGAVLRPAAGVTTAVLIGMSGDTVSDARYQGFTIDGAYDETGLVLAGVQVTNGARLDFDHLRITGTARQGILLSGTTDGTVERCEVTRTGLDGNSAGHAVSFTGSPRGSVRGCAITDGLGMGVALISGSTDADISHNDIRIAPSAIGFEAIGIAATNDRAVVAGNRVRETQDNGISLSASDCACTGNVVAGTVNSGLAVAGSRNTVTGNVVKNVGREVSATQFAAVTLAGSTAASHNVISGNTLYDDQATKTSDYGVRETAGADGNLIIGNICRASDFLAAAITTVGARTVAANNVTT